MIYKTLYRKLNNEEHESHTNLGEVSCSTRVSSSCSTSEVIIKA